MEQTVDSFSRLTSLVGGRYRFERELGHGGMATVFLAEDTKHKRLVALKVLEAEVANAVGPDRFLQEIEIAASLAHPNVLPLYDSGESQGLLYYVMPYVEGETLRDRLIREKQLPLDDAIRIIGDVAEGVEYAHQHDIIHRDLKPENILLHGDRAVVADFGIARALSRSAKEPLTSSGVILGTAQYMSPEQALGEGRVDVRTDIYSLGCVFYEMLAGETPYTGPTLQAIVTRHALADIPSIKMLRPDLPEEIDTVIRKALGKVPAARYASAAAFSQSVKAAATHKRKWIFRGKRPLAIAAGIAVIAVAATFAFTKGIFAGSLDQNDWVLAGDFEGPPKDSSVAPAFRDLVTTALSQSHYIRVIERRDLNEIMRQAGISETTFVDLDLGRQLAQRGSVRAVLVGSLRPLGSGYSTVMHIVSADDGRPLASAAAVAEGPNWQQGLVKAAEEVANSLRSQLGEHQNDLAKNRPLRDVATPSFAAFKYYSKALDKEVTLGDFAGANVLLDSAIALDSSFAWAWVGKATNLLTERQLDSARFAYTKALSLPQRLSAAEQYHLKGDMAYALDHDIPAALKWYDLYVAEVPYSTSGRSNRALYRTALGQYEEAERDLKQAVGLSPFGAGMIQPALLNLAAVQVILGHMRDGQATMAKLSGPFLQYMQIMTANAQSQWADADSAALVSLATPGVSGLFRTNAVTAHASALAAQGSVVAADSVLRDAVVSSKGSTARWYERARLLLNVATHRTLGSSALSESDTSLAADMLRILREAQSGDTLAARKRMQRLNNLSPRERAIIGSGPLLAESLIALRARNFQLITERLAPVALKGEQDPTMLDRPDSFLQRWLVADAYEGQGKLDSAAVFLELALQPTRIPAGHFALRGLTYGLAHHELAEIDSHRGDLAGEREHRAVLQQAFTHPDRVTSPLLMQRSGFDTRACESTGPTAYPPQCPRNANL
ncbi:MAG TPA: protein kinase [Terriglobales bacterium]|nr:protein kinase [Terriglobales bacterium]